MTAKMPDIPERKTWRDDPITPRQLGMINWLLNCRGIVCRPKRGTMLLIPDLTRGKASELGEARYGNKGTSPEAQHSAQVLSITKW